MNYPRVQKFNWLLVYIGSDEETKEPKQIAVTGVISTKMRGRNKIKREVMKNLKVSEDFFVLFDLKKDYTDAKRIK